MAIELNELENVEDLSGQQMRDTRGGFFGYHYYNLPYHWLYRPVVPMNTFAGALNHSWAARGQAFDRSFNNWLSNF